MTQPIIKPTVGRVVWFHPSEFTGEAGFARHPDGQPYAAIIARVWSNILVNLTVFDANGAAHSRTSVPLVQDGGGAPQDDSYCEWMPYQKGQAAKTEAAEKSATEAQPAYRERTQREVLEYALVDGAAKCLPDNLSQAAQMAEVIKVMLDALHPAPVLTNPHTGTPRDPRDVASDPQAALCVKAGEPLKAAPLALPVIDPGPDSLEREIQAKASAAPRVTPADIEAEIASEHYFTAADGVIGESGHDFDARHVAAPLKLLTFCVLVLRNGFTVTGESACASPENFDAEIGRRIARENAVAKLWTLLGFSLRQRLHEQDE